MNNENKIATDDLYSYDDEYHRHGRRKGEEGMDLSKEAFGQVSQPPRARCGRAIGYLFRQSVYPCRGSATAAVEFL